MIKIDGVDIPRIEYIDPVDGKVSILRVMQDGVQIWPIESGVPNIPTGIQLSEYEIVDTLEIPTGITLREVIEPQFDADYQAVLDYATGQGYTLPSEGQQELQNQLMLDLKLYGEIGNAAGLYVPATDGSMDFANINWINPGVNSLARTSAGVVWTQNLGYKGIAASSQVVTTGILPSGTYSKQIIIYNTVRGTSTDLRSFYGTANGYFKAFTNPNDTVNVRLTNSTAVTFTTINSNTEKFMYFSRDGDNIICVFDSDERTLPSTAGSYPTTGITFLGVSNASQGTDDTVGLLYVGILHNAEYQNVRSVIETYMAAIGAIVLTAEVDAQLIQADNDNVSDTVIEINGVRSSASDTAVANLISRNATVITN